MVQVSLHRQLVLLITGLLLVLLAGICLMSVHNSRNYLEHQMYVHAQDTATSLGLSASKPLADGDLALVQTMVDAIFDRGDFQDITIRNRAGEVVIRRNTNPPPHHAPAWFVGWLSIDPEPGTSELT